MLIIQILTALFSLTGTILFILSMHGLSTAVIMPAAAFILSVTGILVKGKRIKAVVFIFSILFFCLFLGFLVFVSNMPA